MFGYSEAEAMGVPLDRLIPERLRAGHRGYIERLAAGPEITWPMAPEGVSIAGLRKNGEEFPIEAAMSKLTVEGTTILNVDLRDVTEQKRREWEQRFRAELGVALATSLDYERHPARVAQLAARELADFCIVDTVDEAGRSSASMSPVANASRNGYAMLSSGARPPGNRPGSSARHFTGRNRS